MLFSGAPPVCTCGYCAEKKPLFLHVDFGGIRCLQPHAPPPPPTPPYQKQGRDTDGNGNAMLQNLFPRNFKEDIGGRYPRPAPVVKTVTEGLLLPHFCTAAPKCVSIGRLARASHISRPCCDKSVGQSVSPARPVDIAWRGCSLRPSMSAADGKSRRVFRRVLRSR